jgi:hypothetical protein
MEAESWSAERLAPETIAVVRDELDTLVARIVAAVRAQSAVYGDVLAAPEGMGIRLGIEQAIRAFLDALEHGIRPGRVTDEVWRRLGEAEFQAGRSLDDLRAAFRVGTRAAWRGAAELASRAGVSAPEAIALVEAIFLYGDELATDVVEGYLRIQSDQAGSASAGVAGSPRCCSTRPGRMPRRSPARPSWRAGRFPCSWRCWLWPARTPARSPAGCTSTHWWGPTPAALGWCCPTPTAPDGVPGWRGR